MGLCLFILPNPLFISQFLYLSSYLYVFVFLHLTSVLEGEFSKQHGIFSIISQKIGLTFHVNIFLQKKSCMRCKKKKMFHMKYDILFSGKNEEKCFFFFCFFLKLLSTVILRWGLAPDRFLFFFSKKYWYLSHFSKKRMLWVLTAYVFVEK